jgi:hypothetical protein
LNIEVKDYPGEDLEYHRFNRIFPDKAVALQIANLVIVLISISTVDYQILDLV